MNHSIEIVLFICFILLFGCKKSEVINKDSPSASALKIDRDKYIDRNSNFYGGTTSRLKRVYSNYDEAKK